MKPKGKGHISIHRSILDNWVWSKGQKTIFEAWVYILLRANWQDAKIPLGSEFKVIKRGQFFTSQKQLSEIFRWDKKKVKSFLTLLQKDDMILLEISPRFVTITICNYESYQGDGTSDELEKPLKNPSTPPELPTTNKNNNYNKNNIMSIVDHLNGKTGKEFKWDSKKTLSVIQARFNENYQVEDFKKVIDCKVAKWIHDEKMKEYLRPETLFGNKFEGYLNECKPILQTPANYVDHDEYIRGHLNQ